MITAFLKNPSSSDPSPSPNSGPNSGYATVSTPTLRYLSSTWSDLVHERYQGDRIVHRRLIHTADSSLDPLLMMYIRADGKKITSGNATDNAPRAPAAYYREIENHLQKLEKGEGGHEPVERGAIGTAVQVLKELELQNYAPPMVTSNGSEAVVMLWSLGGTTYAITITDGELGYVVRREKKRIKMVDSIDVKTFRLLDFKSSQ